MKKLLLPLYLILSIPFALEAQNYPEMIEIKGGTFILGDTDGNGENWERPTHTVTLSNFKMAKTETTVLQWREYCNDIGRPFPAGMEDYPSDAVMAFVNWNDAVGYCKWLSNKTGEHYRLPTEAEWEFAARGGNETKGHKYAGSFNIEYVGWYNANAKGIHEVALKQPNELGLYDMTGNVLEWCSDIYGAYSSASAVNPRGPATGSYRVLRGGSWDDILSYCRISFRSSEALETRYGYIGFRVVVGP